MINELLEGKTAIEKARTKAAELAKVDFSGKHVRSKYTIEVVSTEASSESFIVYARAWKDGKQVGFGPDGTVDIERFRFHNPPILVAEPTGEISQENIDYIKKYVYGIEEKKTRKLKEDPKEAILQSLEHTISLVAKDGSNIVEGKRGNTTSTFYPAAGANSPVDGLTSRQGVDEIWSSVLSGAGTTASVTDSDQSTFTMATSTSNKYWGQLRLNFCFDTSAIGDSDTISSATLSTYGTSQSQGLGAQTLHVVSATPAATNNLATSDYANYGGTSFASKAYASYSTSGYNDFSLNASGKANISKTGVSKFGILSNWNTGDWASATPTWSNGAYSHMGMYFADRTGTSEDPKLVVEHTAPASTFKSKVIFF